MTTNLEGLLLKQLYVNALEVVPHVSCPLPHLFELSAHGVPRVHVQGANRGAKHVVIHPQLKHTIHHALELNSGSIKLLKGKALRKHSLHEKTAASVLLKLFMGSKLLPRMTHNSKNT